MSGEPRVRRHPDGTRYVQPYLGTNRVTGRRIRPYRSFPDSMSDEEVEAEAARWYAEQLAAARLGLSLRLGELLDQYVSWCEVGHAPANTVRTYRTIVRNYVGRIAGLDPRSVTTSMVDELYQELMRSGGARGVPLSPNTVRGVHEFLRVAYDWLVGRGVCETNPVISARPPRKAPHEAAALDEEELFRMFELLNAELRADPADYAGVVRRHHLFAAWLALHTGMRCGECCAVRRCDVRLAGDPVVRVTGTVVDARGGAVRQPYTKGKRPRTVALAERDRELVALHVAWQTALLGAGTPKRTLVSPDGALCSPNAISRTFTAFARECGMPPGTTFHSLRHTHGTWLLMSGIDVKTTSERLGHANVATTLSIYAHVLPGRDAAAAEAFAGLAGQSR